MRSWKKLCGVMGGVTGLMGVLASQAAANAPNVAVSANLAASNELVNLPEPFLVGVLLAGLAMVRLGARQMRPVAIRQRSHHQRTSKS